MYLSVKQQVKHLSKAEYKTIKELCHIAKNLTNQAIYNIRQYYFAEGKYLSYSKNYDFSEVVKKYKTALENAKKSKTEYEKMSDSALSYTDVYLVIEAVMDTQK